jgi:hypothetical protein
MAQVVLVRHAMPVIEPAVAPELWRLGDDGRAAARRLAGALPRAPFTVTSDEAKAIAVRDALDASDAALLVVVDHGQALTLWLRSVGAVADAPRFWSALAYPDAWTITLVWSRGALLATGAPARLS